ncbi:MAG: hypothetical protein A4S09_13890 [Proteobacteria bacterium SG_bin7]|nr:MAG: hypothetical protein A4S09_13890 [Proteobacteria bacterium SG_bin7]
MTHGLPYSFSAGQKLTKGVQKEIAEAIALAKRWVQEVVNPVYLELDAKIESDSDFLARTVLAKINEWGLLSLWMPKAFGGGGLSPVSMIAFNEEVGATCIGTANIIGAHYVALGLVSMTQNFSLLHRLCLDIKRGEKEKSPCVLAVAITEPNAGTDLEDVDLMAKAQVKTRVVLQDGGYLLSGSKIFISNSKWARWQIVVGYEDIARPHKSCVIMAVPGNAKGVTVGRIEEKMGQHLCPASEVYYEDVVVPSDNVAISPQQFRSQHQYEIYCQLLGDDILSISRAGVGALAAGSARQSMDLCRKFLMSENLLENEWAQIQLADMYRNYQIAKLITWESGFATALYGPNRDVYRTGINFLMRMMPKFLLLSAGLRRSLRERRLRQRGHDKEISALASTAKYTASDLAVKNAQIALSMMGEAGLRQENAIEKVLRDIKLLQIYEGTNQLNRINVFKNVLAPSHFAPFAESL